MQVLGSGIKKALHEDRQRAESGPRGCCGLVHHVGMPDLPGMSPCDAM